MPESLQQTFGNSASRIRSSCHGETSPSRMAGLAMWSSTNGCSGNSATSSTATGRCLREQQQVVGQTELPQLRDAAAKFRQQHEVVVRFVVDDVPHADQLRMLGILLQLLAEFRRAQVHPADDAFDEVVLVRQLQQPLRLLEHLPRLHRDGAVEPDAFSSGSSSSGR